MTGGIALYRLVAELEEKFDEKKEELVAKLNEMMAKIFCSENLMVSITAEEKDIAPIVRHCRSLKTACFVNR